MGARQQARVGMRFGRLQIAALAAPKSAPSRATITQYECRCDCGSKTTVSWDHLRGGHTKSCGCLRDEVRATIRVTHGHSVGVGTSRAYNVWSKMHARCNDLADTRYGGRGIKVCQEWRFFERFFADMGYPPAGASIDRRDNNGDYSAENCRWATAKEQGRNKRNNRILTIGGDSKCLAEWVEISGANYDTVKRRLYAGWAARDAVFGKTFDEVA